MGNNLADEFAGRARPALTAPPRPWIVDRRERRKLLRELLTSLQPDDLWHQMCSSRPAVARASAVAEPAGEHHLPVFSGSGWACSTCGLAARQYRALMGAECPGRMLAATAAHASHVLHAAEFGDAGVTLRLVLCTACGAHGTSKAINLAKPCPAGAAVAGDRDVPFRRQARLAARGLHPSKSKVPLHGLRPLRLAAAWRAGKCAHAAAAAEEEAVQDEPQFAPPADAPCTSRTEPPVPGLSQEDPCMCEPLSALGEPYLEEVLCNEADWAVQPPSVPGGGRIVHGTYPELQLPTDFAGAEDEELVLGEDWDM